MKNKYVVELLNLSWPIIISRIGTFIIILTDILMVGDYGELSLAGYTSGNYFNTVFWISGINAIAGIRVYITHAIGKKDYARSHQVLTEGLKISLIIAGIFFLLSITAKYWLSMLGFQKDLAEATGTIVLYLGFGIFGHLLYAAISFYFEAIQRPVISMWIVICGVLSNFVLNYVLAHGWFSNTPLLGIASSTAIVRFMMFVAAFIFLIWVLKLNPFQHFVDLAQRKSVRKDLLSYGTASFISGSMTFVIAMFAVIAGVKGVIEAAVYQVFINMVQFTSNFTNGITAALSIKVGHFFKQIDSVKHIFRYIMSGAFICTSIVVAFYATFLLLDKEIALLYSNSENINTLLIDYVIRFGFLYILLDSLSRVVVVTARGMGDKFFTTAITVVSYVTGLIAAYVQCLVLSYDIEWLFIDMMLANMVIAGGISIKFRGVFYAPIMVNMKYSDKLNSR